MTETIDLSQYMTVAEARDLIGAAPRGIWRAIARAGRDKVTVKFFGRTLVRKDAIEAIRAHYYPYYSEAHQAMVKKWGAKGGTQKVINNKTRKAKQ